MRNIRIQMSNRRLLLLSNSKNKSGRYLGHAKDTIREFLGRKIKKVLFVPFARVLPSFNDFTSIVRESFQCVDYEVSSIHEAKDQKDVMKRAEAIVVGGGNTFQLLHNLYEAKLLEIIQACVNRGVPYIGWSAGANIVCPTIKTTNDMPIIEPQSFNSLHLVPFQINPHYTEFHLTGHSGETRAERITEFIELNPNIYVIGLRDGSMLRIEGSSIELLGNQNACIFIKGKEATNYSPKDSLQFLMADTKLSQ